MRCSPQRTDDNHTDALEVVSVLEGFFLSGGFSGRGISVREVMSGV